MNATQVKQSTDTLAAVLVEIDAGGLEATEAERAFLAGAEHALRAVSD
jgi:hypothetical protein